MSVQRRFDAYVKGPTPSLRGAKRRGNLSNIRLITRLLPPSAVACYGGRVASLAMTPRRFFDFLRDPQV